MKNIVLEEISDASVQLKLPEDGTNSVIKNSKLNRPYNIKMSEKVSNNWRGF